MSEEMFDDSLPLLHVYGQHYYHGPAMLRGNRAGLVELYVALEQALATRHGVASVSAIDGEGYSLEIHQVNLQATMGEPEYLYQLEYAQGAAAYKRESRIGMAVRQSSHQPVLDKMKIALVAARDVLVGLEGTEKVIEQINKVLE